ncbi:hypothetical protein GM3708_2039 [Geminocystis sp. NIES-3708]|nr:hypothetical protein GM3708_2039 [Geminocystis sp. NIES-3708]
MGISKQSFYERAITLLISGKFPFDSDGSNKVAIDSKDIEQVVKDNLQDLAKMVADNPDFLQLVSSHIIKLKDTNNIPVKEAQILTATGLKTQKLISENADKIASTDNELKVMESVDIEVNAVSGIPLLEKSAGLNPLCIKDIASFDVEMLAELNTKTVKDKDIEDTPEIINKSDSQGDFVVSQVFIDKLKALPYRFNTQRDLELALGIPETYLSKYKKNPEKLVRWQPYLNALEIIDGVYVNKFSTDKPK